MLPTPRNSLLHLDKRLDCTTLVARGLLQG